MSSNTDAHSAEPSAKARRALIGLRRAIQTLREIDPGMPSSYIDMFLAVALDPGKGPSEYARQLGTIQPVASRILLEIGMKARERDSSYALVDWTMSPTNLKSKEYRLTSKGRALRDKVAALLAVSGG